ncbi:unnamed protein product [Dovyalis caffra]|uniref:Uncharacterized protein n=1 Tax=Dovyalis caffra TaxID=77055 RepID=A0AAV1SVC0_9ROSI|nr:unnamed protein product [Dovyalis caffra]
MEPTLDVDGLKDPEQFFLALQRLEGELHINAKVASGKVPPVSAELIKTEKSKALSSA